MAHGVCLGFIGYTLLYSCTYLEASNVPVAKEVKLTQFCDRPNHRGGIFLTMQATKFDLCMKLLRTCL